MIENISALSLTDDYKLVHYRMYPKGLTKLYSNLTPRKSRIPGIDYVVVVGIQYTCMEYFIDRFNRTFFHDPNAVQKFKRLVDASLGEGVVTTDHIQKLWDLQYLPIKVKAIPEGTIVPIGTPILTITNTVDHAAWLVNYLETLISNTTWQMITSATKAYDFRKLLDQWAIKTTGSNAGVQFQGHDFSKRGMSSPESALLSGFGHILSFEGSDTFPVIEFAEMFYGADVEKEMIATSVPATEHSVMCAGTKDDEIGTFKALLDEFPTGILSVVSDTWDLWKVCTEYLPQLKEQILARDGKLVIRPDSGDPVDIICGAKIEVFSRIIDAIQSYEDRIWDNKSEYENCTQDSIIIKVHEKFYKLTANLEWVKERGAFSDNSYYTLSNISVTVNSYEPTPSEKGVVELLWDIFGGTINEQGYKMLDPHIAVIYGDSITRERAVAILERLAAKGFASTYTTLGIGSYTYQFNTRDTFGFAVKATYAEVEVDGVIEKRELFKDPITDDGTKKSRKGLLRVDYDEDGNIVTYDQQTEEQEEQGLLQTVFLDGKMIKTFTLSEIRERLKQQ